MPWTPEQKRERRAENKARIGSIKVTAGCIDCGYNAHPEALGFDHVDGEKLANVSDLLSECWERLQAEIVKCEVRCQNCHAVMTARRRDAVT